jgi:rSAM/selenodomain-associated transferase 1
VRDEHLIIFVKAPRPGEVKTRLAEAIGPDAACAAYRQLAETLFLRLSSLENVELRFAPDDAGKEVAGWLRDGWQKMPQGSGDLGARLNRAFSEAFQRGCKRVVIIGSDCGDVEAADIRAAWASLRDHDLIIGPASDGGYWLIGLRREQPLLFENIAWSSREVLGQTLARAQSASLRTRLLRELADVDTEEEWRAFLLKTEKNATWPKATGAAPAGSAKSRRARQ